MAAVVASARGDISKPPPVPSLLLCVLDVLAFLSREEMDPYEVRKSPPSGLCQCFHSLLFSVNNSEMPVNTRQCLGV